MTRSISRHQRVDSSIDIESGNDRAAFSTFLALCAPILAALLVAGLDIELPLPVIVLTVLAPATIICLKASRGVPATPILSPALVMLSAIYIVGILRLPESLAPDEGSTVLRGFITIGIVPGIAFAIIVRNSKELIPDFKVLAPVLVLMVFLLTTLTQQFDLNQRLAVGTVSPIWIARSLGVIGILAATDTRFTLRQRTVLLMVAAFGIVASGSRAPLIALIVAYVAHGVIFDSRLAGAKVTKSANFVARIVAVIVLSVGLYLLLDIIASDNRLLAFGEGRSIADDPSTQDRIELYRAAWSLWGQRPLLGFGAGSFASLPFSAGWAHNVVLELGSEHGLPGLALFLGALISAFRAARRSERSDLQVGLIYSLVTAFTSGSLGGNYMLWWFILMAGCSRKA